MPDFTHESTDVAVRFHRDSEWYVTSSTADLHTWRVQATDERVVELLHRLAMQLEGPVDVELNNLRDGRQWSGALRPLQEVREALGRMRWPLASCGGVELALVTADDQLTLTPDLSLVVYSRSDRWTALLEAEGVVGRAETPPVQWRRSDVPWTDAPELDTAVDVMVARLALETTT
jgi:hypothetical protein